LQLDTIGSLAPSELAAGREVPESPDDGVQAWIDAGAEGPVPFPPRATFAERQRAAKLPTKNRGKGQPPRKR